MGSGIYQIISPSGKCYIGSSVNLNKRWVKHKYQLRTKTHPNRHLQNAWDKYNGNLEFNVLLPCENKFLLEYEQLFLDVYQPEYNIAKSSDKSFYALGVKRTEETKNKISTALKGKSKKGHPMSDENKKKMSESKMGANNPMFGKTPWNKKHVAV